MATGRSKQKRDEQIDTSMRLYGVAYTYKGLLLDPRHIVVYKRNDDGTVLRGEWKETPDDV